MRKYLLKLKKLKPLFENVFRLKFIVIAFIAFIVLEVLFKIVGGNYLDESFTAIWADRLLFFYVVVGIGAFLTQTLSKIKKKYLISWLILAFFILLILSSIYIAQFGLILQNIFILLFIGSLTSLIFLLVLQISKLKVSRIIALLNKIRPKKATLLKIYILIPVSLVVIFCLYIFDLHTLAVEGNKIFEERCLVVNPPLINYKNAFLKFADFLNNPDKYPSDEIADFYGGYISGMRKYAEVETKWLEADRRYLDRWDFKLVEPWYIKVGGEYQWKMYEGYRDDAKYILKSFDEKEMTPETEARMKEAKARRDKYARLYFDFFNEASKINDWRKIFANVPMPKGCNEENLIIPNTAGSINESNDSASPSTSTIPTDYTNTLI